MATKSYDEVDLNEEDNKVLLKMPNHKFVWYDGVNRQVFLPQRFLKVGQDILNMNVRADDTWVVSYPKAGTTWTQEMVWCIMNDLDFKKAEVPLYKRFPFLEYEIFVPETVYYSDLDNNSVNVVNRLTPPRFIKSHLPWNLLPQQIQNGSVRPKIIYVTRNPKDVCASFYNHYRILEHFQGSLEEFCELFINNKVLYGSLFYNVETYLKNKHVPNLLIIKYEDMKKNLGEIIEKVAKFLNKNLTDQQIEQLLDHLSFEKMKNNPAVNYEDVIEARKAELRPGDVAFSGSFINQGQVGYSKTTLPDKYVNILEEQCRKFEEKTQYKFQSN